MKTFTNHTPGARGINTHDGTVWLDPGESVELDPKAIVGGLPDLGKPAGSVEAAGDLDGLASQVAELAKQVEELTAEKSDLEMANAELAKQVEELTKPDPLDHDGNGKKGGSKPHAG